MSDKRPTAGQIARAFWNACYVPKGDPPFDETTDFHKDLVRHGADEYLRGCCPYNEDPYEWQWMLAERIAVLEQENAELSARLPQPKREEFCPKCGLHTEGSHERDSTDWCDCPSEDR